jgi:alpha-beta hydrolase superfamily lysophospholipase
MLMLLEFGIGTASAQQAAKPEGSQIFYDTAGATDKTIELYQGHYHDLLNDIGRDEVLGDIIEWIEAHLSA